MLFQCIIFNISLMQKLWWTKYHILNKVSIWPCICTILPNLLHLNPSPIGFWLFKILITWGETLSIKLGRYPDLSPLPALQQPANASLGQSWLPLLSEPEQPNYGRQPHLLCLPFFPYTAAPDAEVQDQHYSLRNYSNLQDNKSPSNRDVCLPDMVSRGQLTAHVVS